MYPFNLTHALTQRSIQLPRTNTLTACIFNNRAMVKGIRKSRSCIHAHVNSYVEIIGQTQSCRAVRQRAQMDSDSLRDALLCGGSPLMRFKEREFISAALSAATLLSPFLVAALFARKRYTSASLLLPPSAHLFFRPLARSSASVTRPDRNREVI